MLYAGTPPPPVRVETLTPVPTPVPGSLVGHQLGHFKLLKELGRGGMGTVMLAEHALIQKRVAIKVLHSHLAQDPDLVARFLSEARTLTVVQHENVVALYDLDTRDGRPYLVMEYLEGQSLAAFAKEPLPPALVVDLLSQVCDALGAAHAHGIVHRDLKPANVFLVPGPQGRQRVKLLDFGIAKLLSRPAGVHTTEVGVLLGTPEFMAPEQCGDEVVDARTDLYAVGVLGYFLLTGRVPFAGRTAAEVLIGHLQKPPVPPHEVRPDVPRTLSRVLLRALAKRPADRFAQASDLRAALATALVPEPEPAAPGFTARVRMAGAPHSHELSCEWVGRAGLFLHTPAAPPPLLSDVGLLLRLPGGELACTGQVVRHVTEEQARAWRMSPGFGVQLRDTSPAFQEALARLKSGVRLEPPTPPPSPMREDAEAERVLQGFRNRMSGDHYAVLEVPRDATPETLRVGAQRARTALEPLKARNLSLGQRAQLERVGERVAAALHVLGHVERRAEYDARLGNVEGVERCLAAGLTATALENCRRRFLAEFPGRDGRAAVQRLSGDALSSVGRLQEALAAYEQAVRMDPLDLEGLKRWRMLRARLRNTPTPR
ncbi:protein kinase [Myxococcus sp. MISCRS1]|jgi:serine/threonine-protein kinase|uniref:serine/threonine-protein kinase n=1 Tax=unclassified Myxococcus TaxID=2648731 RepID=UPI001CC11336|nr:MULTISPECIES: serine/threonine-protein kinase [unclassified Myxococcus]MBZ4395751.1 protein kinase [Myxococcus sp. AS-1-15]MBZ4411367.1 protein kinase [Myxococcus sp. XM-1-1-1]MCY0998886.1 protein kinase [Myxococcus sp. MISCRS1]BDT31111.1 serine/threonine protein kinase [Myxococcus sp. MH1]